MQLQKSAAGQDESGQQDVDHVKRVFSRQRAKDLADHAKNMLGKDKEIEELRKKCQELADQLSNGELLIPQVGNVCELLPDWNRFHG